MKTKHWLLFGTAAMILAVAFILTGCPDTSGDKEPEKIAAPAPSPASQDVFAIDISQETDWNYMVVGKDGSSLFFNADESTGIPTLAYLKPEKDSDAGLTLLFKENGLPDKSIANGYVFGGDPESMIGIK